MSGIILPGTAAATDVATGKTFSSQNGFGISGQGPSGLFAGSLVAPSSSSLTSIAIPSGTAPVILLHLIGATSTVPSTSQGTWTHVGHVGNNDAWVGIGLSSSSYSITITGGAFVTYIPLYGVNGTTSGFLTGSPVAMSSANSYSVPSTALSVTVSVPSFIVFVTVLSSANSIGFQFNPESTFGLGTMFIDNRDVTGAYSCVPVVAGTYSLQNFVSSTGSYNCNSFAFSIK